MKKLLIALLVIALSLTMVACGAEKEPERTEPDSQDTVHAETQVGKDGLKKEDLKVGFLYGSPVGDEGYTYAHDLGRLELEAMGVKTMYVENVPATSDCEKTINDLIDQGCNVIYGISFGFGEFMANVAPDHPDVYFGHATGYLTDDNLSTYMGRLYEPHYLAGIAAGMRTETGKIGFVTTFPIPECIRMVNAYTLGARSVNPAATVEVKWTSAWFDPVAEKAAAIELMNVGCDVIGAYCDTLNPQMAAAEEGKWATGCNSPGYDVIPNAYLTAPLAQYGVFYTSDIQRILDGEWSGNENLWMGLDTGVVAIDEISDNCVEGTQEAVEKAKVAIIDGSLFVFDGPLNDNTGVQRLAEGERLSDEDMLTLDWFVEGVIGSVE